MDLGDHRLPVLGGLITGEVSFSAWTVVAVVVVAAMLFQLFRPTPKFEGKNAAGKLEVEKNAA